jgi:hypothetical protein
VYEHDHLVVLDEFGEETHEEFGADVLEDVVCAEVEG